MPKGNPEFERRLDFFTTHETIRKIQAIAIQKGLGKKMSPGARFVAELGIQAYIEGLDREDRIEFENLLERIKLLGL